MKPSRPNAESYGENSDPAAIRLHQVVDYTPGMIDERDSRRVGPAQVYELADVLLTLGFAVELEAEEHYVPSRDGGLSDDIALYALGPDTAESALLVLRWTGEQVLSGAAGAAATAIVKAWIAKRRGRTQSAKTSRDRAVAVARWRLGIEYGVPLNEAKPIGLTHHADGSWTVEFNHEPYEILSARVPHDVDDLAGPGAVETRMRMRRAR